MCDGTVQQPVMDVGSGLGADEILRTSPVILLHTNVGDPNSTGATASVATNEPSLSTIFSNLSQLYGH